MVPTAIYDKLASLSEALAQALDFVLRHSREQVVHQLREASTLTTGVNCSSEGQ
jgi:hypothetical protein